MTPENKPNKLEEILGHVRHVRQKVDRITDYLRDFGEVLREIHDAAMTGNDIGWYDLYGADDVY